LISFFLINRLIFRKFLNIYLVVKVPQKDKSQPPNKEELDEIFEETLRPLQSRNARHIFLVLRDSKEEYLTTYDIQPILEAQRTKLNKVELNNWLSALQDVGIVQKAPERGKPTTKPYNRRYTFDLWKLSQKGRETSILLEVFMGNTPIQTVEKVVEKTIEKIVEKPVEKIVEKHVEIPKFPELAETNFEELDQICSLSMHLTLLRALYPDGVVDLWSLSDETGYTPEKIVEFIENQEKIKANTLYLLREIPMDLRGKIMEKLGLSPRKNYTVSLRSEGKLIASSMSP